MTTGLIERGMTQRGGDTRKAASALERAGIRMAVADFVLMVAAAGLVAVAAGYIVGGPVLAVLLGGLTVAGSKTLLTFRAGKRKSDFGNQLDDMLQLLAGNMRRCASRWPFPCWRGPSPHAPARRGSGPSPTSTATSPPWPWSG